MQPPVILVVDDDDAIRELLVDLLVDAGYEVATARDGLAGLHFLDEIVPDLILLDVAMPYIDGPTFIHSFRELQLQIPVIIMSATVQAREVAQACGTEGYLDKPFEPDAMLALVAQLIG